MKCGRKELVVLSSILMCALLAGGLLFKVVLESYSEGRDRAGCLVNIKNIQTAMRSHCSTKTVGIGSYLDKSTILQYFGEDYILECPSGGTYTFKDKVPRVGVLYCTCSHAKTKGHEFEDFIH